MAGQAGCLKEVSWFVWAMEDGKFLIRGTCFEGELLEEYKELKKSGYFKEAKWMKLLEKEINKGEKHPQDVLDEIFNDNVSLDFDFAKELKQYDIIKAECFTQKNELGAAILQLIVMADSHFIIHRREFESKNNLKLHFEVCHGDSEFECHNELIKGNVDN